ncbi:t-SNARE [Coemansia reversa NRRL 1564]|uniref:t-SNARE n=1 Tax=Coemansia reversa (strain ATCC 12441 / NRRL 1564) TaxID=763665 RepID=A0A2G5BB85_COERN|nr:t-SNARE [Coemansia reversa NRRL 1564]|eukprot:PIA16279.1 t-SNARE [Coemansia reversa NRRL 1564]
MGRDIMAALKSGSQPHSSIDERASRSRAGEHTAIEMDQLNGSHRAGDNNAARRGHSIPYPHPPESVHVANHYGGTNGNRPTRRHDVLYNSVDLTEFNEKANSIKRDIEMAYLQIGKVKTAHEKTLNATGEVRISVTSAMRDDEIKKAQKAIEDIKAKMRILDKEKRKHMETPLVSKSQKVAIASRYQRLAERMKVLLNNYRSTINHYLTRYRMRLKQEYLIANPDATSEEAEDAVYDDKADQAFAQAVKRSNKADAATNILNKVRERRDDIIRIEKDVQKLAEMISDIAQLVNDQQHILDNIEEAIEEPPGG